MSVRRTCPSCGASNPVAAEWCLICHERFPEPEEEAAAPGFAPPDAHPEVPMLSDLQWSRWRKTSTTFGPIGRILATIVVCIIPVLWLGSTLFPMAIVWIVTVWPFALRSIWQKGRIT